MSEKFMKHLDYFENIANHMRDYQKNNNISGNCITNARYLSDCVNHGSPYRAKTVNVIVTGTIDTNFIVNTGHIVVIVIDNFGKKFMIDPSFDVHRMDNKQYFYTIAEFKKHNTVKKDELKDNLKSVISAFLKFNSMTEKLNKDEIMLTSYTDDVENSGLTYYNNQADYIESVMKS